MLFVAEYDFDWEALSAVVAKRLEWGEVQPETFRFVGEFVWQDRHPPFRGIAIIETDDVEALNAFALHYGPTLNMAIHPASDVASGIALVRHGGDGGRRSAGVRSGRARRPRSGGPR
ncbi:MAG: DUF3303 family protein [bacterium]